MKWVFIVSGIVILASLAYLFLPLWGKDPEFQISDGPQRAIMEDGRPVGFKGPTSAPSMKGPSGPPPAPQ